MRLLTIGFDVDEDLVAALVTRVVAIVRGKATPEKVEGVGGPPVPAVPQRPRKSRAAPAPDALPAPGTCQGCGGPLPEGHAKTCSPRCAGILSGRARRAKPAVRPTKAAPTDTPPLLACPCGATFKPRKAPDGTPATLCGKCAQRESGKRRAKELHGAKWGLETGFAAPIPATTTAARKPRRERSPKPAPLPEAPDPCDDDGCEEAAPPRAVQAPVPPPDPVTPTSGDCGLPDGPSMTRDQIEALGYEPLFISRMVRSEHLVLDHRCRKCGHDGPGSCGCSTVDLAPRFTRESVRSLLRSYKPQRRGRVGVLRAEAAA